MSKPSHWQVRPRHSQHAVDVKLLVRTDQVEPASIPVVSKINYTNLVDYKDTGSLSASSRCLNSTVDFTMSRLWQVCLLLEGSYGEVTIVFQLLEAVINLGPQPLYIPNHSKPVNIILLALLLLCPVSRYCGLWGQDSCLPTSPAVLWLRPWHFWFLTLGTSYLSAPRARLESDQDSMC